MSGICTLDVDINRCPNYDRQDGSCNADQTGCGFYAERRPEMKPQEYKRKKRWYEEYMK